LHGIGLRKRVKVFQQKGYTENFIQAILSAIPGGPEGKKLIIGGDGRYYNKEAISLITKIAAGNKVAKLTIGKDGIMSTPAVSNLIRKSDADGAIILTASHNPGGPSFDFGMKFNMANGGPAPEISTERVWAISKNLTEYYMMSSVNVDISTVGLQKFGEMQVDVIDAITDYVWYMKDVFDFNIIKDFFKSRPDFTMLFNGMHAATGPYAKRIFVQELGLPESVLMNCEPLEDFGGEHPDPNLTYGHELVERVEKEGIDFGAASDGDGDRNMILGRGVFVNPSDSVAIIANNADYIPYFKRTGLKGVARSMPTGSALDRYFYIFLQ
jgi:phosphoglucomutase